jgi:hypothetical protein
MKKNCSVAQRVATDTTPFILLTLGKVRFQALFLNSGQVFLAYVVFEIEPLLLDSQVNRHLRCVLKAQSLHSTEHAVARTSGIEIHSLMQFLAEDVFIECRYKHE